MTLFLLEHGENPLKELPNLLAVVNLVGAETASETDERGLHPALPSVDGAAVGEEAELECEADASEGDAEHPREDEFGLRVLDLEEFEDCLVDDDDAAHEEDKT